MMFVLAITLLFWTDYNIPDSLAEATTAPLEDNELGGNATQDDVKNDK